MQKTYVLQMLNKTQCTVSAEKAEELQVKPEENKVP